MALRAEQVTDGEKFAQACEDVKGGILAIIADELIPAPPDPPDPTERVPRLWSRAVVNLNDPDAWAGDLQSDRHIQSNAGSDVSKVHTFAVSYGGIETYDGRAVGSKGFALRFIIASYYEDETGTDADNPEKAHNAEIGKVVRAFYASGNLRCPGLVKRVTRFRERRGIIPMGTAQIRQSLAEIFVELHPIPIPLPGM